MNINHIHQLWGLKSNNISNNLCNPTCYKTNVDGFKKLCRYCFHQPLINEIHVGNEIKNLNIKRTNKWLYNANPWILSASRCNHDLKFTVASGQYSKYLIYYIIDHITKTSIYITHMYFCYK